MHVHKCAVQPSMPSGTEVLALHKFLQIHSQATAATKMELRKGRTWQRAGDGTIGHAFEMTAQQLLADVSRHDEERMLRAPGAEHPMQSSSGCPTCLRRSFWVAKCFAHDFPASDAEQPC